MLIGLFKTPGILHRLGIKEGLVMDQGNSKIMVLYSIRYMCKGPDVQTVDWQLVVQATRSLQKDLKYCLEQNEAITQFLRRN